MVWQSDVKQHDLRQECEGGLHCTFTIRGELDMAAQQPN
jgi:hypothetical protein